MFSYSPSLSPFLSLSPSPSPSLPLPPPSLPQSTLEVTIAASDNPYGILSFTPSSLTLTEDETQSGTITILRNPGLFGDTFIYWEIVPATNTFSSNNNTVVFGAGVTAVDISIELQANTVPVSHVIVV